MPPEVREPAPAGTRLRRRIQALTVPAGGLSRDAGSRGSGIDFDAIVLRSSVALTVCVDTWRCVRGTSTAARVREQRATASVDGNHLPQRRSTHRRPPTYACVDVGKRSNRRKAEVGSSVAAQVRDVARESAPRSPTPTPSPFASPNVAPAPSLHRQATAIDLAGCGFALLVIFHLMFRGYFPNSHGLLGHDYAYFLPHLLAGDFWIWRNGFLAVPWFTPAFCGGLPTFANPQSPIQTLPQLLSATLFDPLTAVYATFLVFAWLGYAGMYLLVRRVFMASRPAAVLAAAVFLFNGLYTHRMMVGHLTFHPFMLGPMVAYLLLRTPGGVPTLQAFLDVVLAAALLAYMIVAGMVPAMLPLLLSLAAFGLWHSATDGTREDAKEGTARGRRAAFWIKFGMAGSLAAMFSAARLSAGVSFLEQFPRDDYSLPGASSIGGALQLAAESLFLRPAYAAAKTIMVHSQWPMDQHEWEFGVTFVPLLALVAWGVVSAVRRRQRAPGHRRPAILAAAMAGAVILSAPIALNVYSPSWNALLKEIPMLRNSASLVRWFSLYIPLLAAASALALDAVVRSAGARRAAAIVGIAACIAVHAVEDDAFYVKQPYDPAPVTDAYHRIDQGIPDIVAIGDKRVVTNDLLVRGQSPPICYEPIFGYEREHLPWAPLHSGPILDEKDGRLNLKNPACYIFPKENGCVPGDHFPVQRRDDALALAAYRPFPFVMSSRQAAANAISVASLLGALAFVLFYAVRAASTETR